MSSPTELSGASVCFAALISLSFGGAIGLMFLMLGCALPIYKYVMDFCFPLFECLKVKLSCF